jgi:type IV pilus assembly protein PilO
MMTFDLSQFDDLALENMGKWPKAAKLLLIIFLSLLVFFIGYYFVISHKITLLEQVASQESSLLQQYKSKYHIAANLALFQAQLLETEIVFAHQLRRLPISHEIPGLLDDITFIGTSSGLDFVKLNWQPEIVQDIYIELPIDIEVIGSYHQLANFVSEVANLPRIVTLHDFKIEVAQVNTEALRLTLQAKTYRYQEANK